MQGKDEKKVEYTLAKRITPACAGKRILPPKLNTLPRNHPCVCREKEESGKEGHTNIGSPLRVQGKAISRAAAAAHYRITPACAGKSLLLFLFSNTL